MKPVRTIKCRLTARRAFDEVSNKPETDPEYIKAKEALDRAVDENQKASHTYGQAISNENSTRNHLDEMVSEEGTASTLYQEELSTVRLNQQAVYDQEQAVKPFEDALKEADKKMQQWINEMTIYSKREITIKDYLQTERDNLKQIKKVLEDINLTDEDKKVEDMSKQFERLHAIYKKYIEALANYGIAKSQYEEFLAKEVNIKADTKAEIQSGSETKTKIKHSTPKTGDNASQEAALLITGLAGVAISKVRRKR